MKINGDCYQVKQSFSLNKTAIFVKSRVICILCINRSKSVLTLFPKSDGQSYGPPRPLIVSIRQRWVGVVRKRRLSWTPAAGDLQFLLVRRRRAPHTLFRGPDS